MEAEKLENLLVERLCRRNGWEHPEDCDNAVRDIKWFLSQPEISFKAGEDKGKQEGFDKVVEFVNQYALVEDALGCNFYIGDITIFKGFWQAFLKERGK